MGCGRGVVGGVVYMGVVGGVVYMGVGYVLVCALVTDVCTQINSSSGLAEKARHLEELLALEKAQRGEATKRVRAVEAELEEVRRSKGTLEEELNQQRQRREKVCPQPALVGVVL